MKRSYLLILGGLVLGGLVLFLALQFPEALTTQDDQIQLTQALLLVGVIGGAAIAHGRFKARQALRYGAIWVGLGAVLLLGYSFRAEFSAIGDRLAGELLPHRAQETAGGAVMVRAGENDHFIVEARVNGMPIRFLVDVILPLSRTNIAALFVIMFAYGWNQYLWPLIVTTDPQMTTMLIGIQRALSGSDELTPWNLVMAMSLLALLPPLAVVLGMQRWFVKGLVDAEK